MTNVLDPTLATFQASPNKGKKFAPGLPDTLIIHYTAGASLESSVKSLCDPAHKASAHLVVGRDGKVVQLVEFDTVAWHAGVSGYRDRVGMNQFSIGIEIDNPGRLTRTASGEFITWFGGRVPADQVISAQHRNETAPDWWHTYADVQIKKVFDLAELLTQQFQIKYILGHEEIAPGRKSDPGPAFPLDRLRDRFLGSQRNLDTLTDSDLRSGVVTASLLNTRKGPSTNTALAGEPLKRGTPVSVSASQNGWLKIETPVSAWVRQDYVEFPGDAPAAATP